MEPPTAPPPPRSSRWPHPILWALLLLAVLAPVGLWTAVRVVHQLAAKRAETDLEAAIAEVDAAEPNGWQWEDLERQREKVPDDQNGALIVLDAARLLPDDNKWKHQRIFDEISDLPPPAELTAEQTRELREVLNSLEPPLKAARKLIAYPKGRSPARELSRNAFATPASPMQKVRDLGVILSCDALMRCQERRYDDAWDSAVTTLHAGRSMGDDPLAIMQVCRMSTQLLAVRAMERILAHADIESNRLQRAEALLRSEVDENISLMCIRGERAMSHHFYSNIVINEFTLADISPSAVGQVTVWDQLSDSAKRSTVAESHAYTLRILTKAVEAARKLERDRFAALEAVDDEVMEHKVLAAGADAVRVRHLLALLLEPTSIGVARRELRNDTLMECAIAALAAERFRHEQGRWPKDLLELVGARWLPKFPIDPYDGQPLRLRHTKDGLVIYSIGKRKDYDGKAWDDLAVPPPGDFVRIEFRLWNPDRRRQPPVPPQIEPKP
jgi:hypothetical protein